MARVLEREGLKHAYCVSGFASSMQVLGAVRAAARRHATCESMAAAADVTGWQQLAPVQ
jgi:hypothetical protein